MQACLYGNLKMAQTVVCMLANVHSLVKRCGSLGRFKSLCESEMKARIDTCTL